MLFSAEIKWKYRKFDTKTFAKTKWPKSFGCHKFTGWNEEKKNKTKLDKLNNWDLSDLLYENQEDIFSNFVIIRMREMSAAQNAYFCHYFQDRTLWHVCENLIFITWGIFQVDYVLVFLKKKNVVMYIITYKAVILFVIYVNTKYCLAAQQQFIRIVKQKFDINEISLIFKVILLKQRHCIIFVVMQPF